MEYENHHYKRLSSREGGGLRTKKTKINTLYKTTPSILGPFVGEITHSLVLHSFVLLAITTKRFLKNDFLNRLYLGQVRIELYTLFRAEKPKTIPCPAARPLIGPGEADARRKF